MAAAVMPKPGTQFGPCQEGCKHKDCAELKGMAQSMCRFCQKAIGWGGRYYRSQLSGDLAHAACLETAVERNDARVGLF